MIGKFEMADCSSEIKVSAIFHVPAEVLYRIFTDERDMTRLTRSPTKFVPAEGSSFSFFGDSVVGTVARLEPSRSIQMQWRFSSWDSDSTVLISFKPLGSSSEISIHQTHIPPKDRFGNVDQDRLCRVGWEERWINGLASVLGIPKAN